MMLESRIDGIIGQLAAGFATHRQVSWVQKEIRTLVDRGDLTKVEAVEVQNALRPTLLAGMFGLPPRNGQQAKPKGATQEGNGKPR